jgi:hypothetical protein
LADIYASVFENLTEAAGHIQLAAPVILAGHALAPDVDILAEFYNTGNLLDRQLRNLDRFQSPVSTLSRWVLEATGAENIDDMISDAEFTVRQAWADMSVHAGFPIMWHNIVG